MNAFKFNKLSVQVSALLTRTRICNKHTRQCFRKYSIDTKGADNFYDVVICGGGMIGAALAGVFAHEPQFSHLKVLLIEGNKKVELPTLTETYNSRTCALSPASKTLLESFGAWDQICNMRYQPWKKMQVWDSCTDAMITLQPDDADDMAFLVENDVIVEAINRQLVSAPNVTEQRYNTKVKQFKFPQRTPSGKTVGPTWAELHLENGEVIETRLLIGADGSNSPIRRAANIHATKSDYKQQGVCASLELSEPSDNSVAWQRFLPTGPIAMLPISKTHSCLVWSTSNEEARNLLQMSPESFVDAVNHAFWSDDQKNPVVQNVSQAFDTALTTFGLEGTNNLQLPPEIIRVQEGTRACFPLALSHASHYVKERVALIGDAAHRIHPLAGQGANLGFGDVTVLKKVFSDAVDNGTDIGLLHTLLKYEKERQVEVMPAVVVTDSFHRLYGSTWSPTVLMRSLLLQSINATSPVKTAIVKKVTAA